MAFFLYAHGGTTTPCHWGAMNGGCVVVGRPHPSHSFIESHPMVYKIVQVVQKNFWWMRFWWMKNQYLQDEGVDCLSHRMRAFVWDFEGSLSSQWSSRSICVRFWRFPKGSVYQPPPRQPVNVTHLGPLSHRPWKCDMKDVDTLTLHPIVFVTTMYHESNHTLQWIVAYFLLWFILSPLQPTLFYNVQKDWDCILEQFQRL